MRRWVWMVVSVVLVGAVAAIVSILRSDPGSVSACGGVYTATSTTVDRQRTLVLARQDVLDRDPYPIVAIGSSRWLFGKPVVAYVGSRESPYNARLVCPGEVFVQHPANQFRVYTASEVPTG